METMNDNNIFLVLTRFRALFETSLEHEYKLLRGSRQICHHGDAKGILREKIYIAYAKAHKKLIREFAISGCPYKQIWDCKKGEVNDTHS